MCASIIDIFHFIQSKIYLFQSRVSGFVPYWWLYYIRFFRQNSETMGFEIDKLSSKLPYFTVYFYILKNLKCAYICCLFDLIDHKPGIDINGHKLVICEWIFNSAPTNPTVCSKILTFLLLPIVMKRNRRNILNKCGRIFWKC